MEQKQKNWEDLGIENDFLFGKVMTNLDLCKELLQIILPQMKIEHIEVPQGQKSIENDKDAHGVRLDVYVRDDMQTVYTVEMQTTENDCIPKRSRYYTSMVDLQLLDKGQLYKKLNNNYVIFICPFDLFGAKRHLYTFENTCQENKAILLQDGTTKIFLNADSDMDDVNEDLRAFLDYVIGKRSENKFVEKVDEAVREAKTNREWRHEFMTMQQQYLSYEEKGLERGTKLGARVIRLYLKGVSKEDISSTLHVDSEQVESIITDFESE